jgi:hypothetical protein
MDDEKQLQLTWTMLDAPLKAVVMTLLKSCLTGVPSAYLTSSGMTVQPKRTPVKPAYFEKEFT